jgi:hypothetical protein
MTDGDIHIISYTANKGKGYAVRQGVLHLQIKDYVEGLITSDLVIVSKRYPKSSVTIPRSRAFLSRAFNLFIMLATGIPQKDTQTGFKAGKEDIMRTILRNASVNRYDFDIELLTIACILHLKVQEMPIIMKIERKFNTMEIVKMFVDVARISYKYRDCLSLSA